MIEYLKDQTTKQAQNRSKPPQCTFRLSYIISIYLNKGKYLQRPCPVPDIRDRVAPKYLRKIREQPEEAGGHHHYTLQTMKQAIHKNMKKE